MYEWERLEDDDGEIRYEVFKPANDADRDTFAAFYGPDARAWAAQFCAMQNRKLWNVKTTLRGENQ